MSSVKCHSGLPRLEDDDDKKSLLPTLAKKRGIVSDPAQLAHQKPIIIVNNGCRSACQRKKTPPKWSGYGRYPNFTPVTDKKACTTPTAWSPSQKTDPGPCPQLHRNKWLFIMRPAIVERFISLFMAKRRRGAVGWWWGRCFALP